MLGDMLEDFLNPIEKLESLLECNLCESTSSDQQLVDHLNTFNVPYQNDFDSISSTVLGIPEEGYRTRVETQVKLSVKFLYNSNFPFLKISLPRHLLLNDDPVDKIETMEPDTLRLSARVVKSDSDSAIYCCHACICREKRRENKRARLVNVDTPQSNINWEREAEEEKERIILFPSGRLVDIIKGEAYLPIRLVCYCRHHGEKTGFRVRFEFFDHLNRSICFCLTPPILVTDDHKRSIKNNSVFTSSQTLSPGVPFVNKVIPSEGPLYGGIEVTVFGANFSPSTLIKFGENFAKVVSTVSENIIIVTLPPGIQPGLVQVSVESAGFSEKPVFFHYRNNLDSEMMELALQLIGMKLTGRVDDARDVATRIINELSPQIQSNSIEKLSSISKQDQVQELIMAIILSADYQNLFIMSSADFSEVRTRGGQTIIHLAVIANYLKLFSFLIDLFGSEILELFDRNGHSPLSLAVLLGRNDFLETMGLEAIYCGDNVPSPRRASVVSLIDKICRKPSSAIKLLKGLKNFATRQVSSHVALKLKHWNSLTLRPVNFNPGKDIYLNYQSTKPIRGRTRDLWLLYFWVPIVMALAVFWYLNLGSSSPSSAVPFTRVEPSYTAV